MNIKDLYTALHNAQREIEKYSFDYNPQTTFEVNGEEVDSSETNYIALKHGMALSSMSALKTALNNAIGDIGVLESVVEGQPYKRTL